MPRAEKQRPNDARAFAAEPGSILSRAVPVSQLADSWIKMLIYGENGVGKTTLACSFPKPLLLASWEPAINGGARSVRRVPGVTFVQLPTLADTRALIAELVGKCPFKTLVLDSVTSMQAVILTHVMGKPAPESLSFGVVSGDEYRMRSEITKDVLAGFMGLACHTVFIGKEKDHNPPKEEKVGKNGKIQPDMRPRFLRGLQLESFVSVDLGGGAAGWLQDGCDYIGRLYMDREMVTETTTYQGQEITETRETGRFVRALRIGFHPNFKARFRSDAPTPLPDAIEAPTYDKIRAAIDGKKL